MTPEQYHDGNEFFAHAQADRFWCVPASQQQQGEAAAASNNPCVAQSNTATATISGSSRWCCCCKSALSRCLSGLHVTCSVCQQQSRCRPRCLSCYEPIQVHLAVGPAQRHAEQRPAEVLTGRSRLLRSTPCMLLCILCWSSSTCLRQLDLFLRQVLQPGPPLWGNDDELSILTLSATQDTAAPGSRRLVSLTPMQAQGDGLLVAGGTCQRDCTGLGQAQARGWGWSMPAAGTAASALPSQL